MNRTQQSHLARAIRIAAESTSQQKHGVVLAVGPRVLAVAVNTDRNDPNICSDPKKEASYHAEYNALRQIDGHHLRNVTLYSARIGKRGTPLLAKPCPRCQKLIEDLGIKRVFHT